jgi:multicomponent Na+:H+ antiporter subunit D
MRPNVHILIVLPLLLPLATGISALIRYRELRRVMTSAGVFANMAACLILLYMTRNGDVVVTQMGGHPAPYGIALVVDALSAVMLSVTAAVMLAAVLFSHITIDANRERFAYYPLLGFLLLGVNFAFLTGDLFTLYVAFEVMLMSSFVLLTLGGERPQLAGGLKYVTLNLISSTIFLIAAGLTYAIAGTLNLAQLADRLAELPSPGISTTLAGLFLIAFGIKAAIFPLFFWLPASYHTPPIAITALFGGILTKVGIYSMWRVLVMIFPHDIAYLQPIVLVLAAFTMVTGVLGAIAQTDVRRLLSFHIISQIGYLLMGLGLLTERSMTGAVFFVVHVILAKTVLFLVSGITYHTQGSYELKKLGGFQKSQPFLAMLFLLAALSLAGIPPLPGFWAKLTLIYAGLETGQYGVVAVALFVSILTLFSMTKIWHEVFWKPAPAGTYPVPDPGQMRRLLMPTVMLVGLILFIGLYAEPFVRMSGHAARGVLDPASYISTVLVEEEETP